MSDRPLFSNGSEHYDWRERNCWRCVKDPSGYGAHRGGTCDIEPHIAANACGTPLPPEIEQRLGCDDNGYALADCKEREILG